MALQKTERHPENSTTAPFSGYWAYEHTSQAWTKKTAAIRLALYYSPEDYDADAENNVLRVYPTTFIIKGADFDSIFLVPNLTSEQKAFMIFQYIKNYVEVEGDTPYFADAEIVP